MISDQITKTKSVFIFQYFLIFTRYDFQVKKCKYML